MRYERGTMGTFSEALRFYQDGRYDEAARRLRILLEFDRENAQAWMYYGAALGQLGRWSQAADAYRQVVELEPEEATSYVDLATALLECGRLEQAEDALQAALELEPRHPIALEMRERLGASAPPPPPPGPAAETAPATPPARPPVRRPPSRLRLLLALLAALLLISLVSWARRPGEKWRQLREVAALLDQAEAERLKVASLPGEDLEVVTRVEQRQEEAAAKLQRVLGRYPELPEVYVLLARLEWRRGHDRFELRNNAHKALGLLKPLPPNRRRPLGRTPAQLSAELYRLMVEGELAAARGARGAAALQRARNYLRRARELDPQTDLADLERALRTAGR